jgi:hypothetical protein
LEGTGSGEDIPGAVWSRGWLDMARELAGSKGVVVDGGARGCKTWALDF